MAKWSTSESKYYLTDHAEGICLQLFDRRTNYYCAEFEKHKWYVMSKFYLTEDCSPTEYVNVHCVQINDNDRMCLCSCRYKRRTGRPCVHVIAVMDCFHHEMVHPRFYKVYNSNFTMKTKDLKESLLEARLKCESDPDVISIETSINEVLHQSVAMRNGCTDEHLLVMEKIWKRNEKGIITTKNDVMEMMESHFDKNDSFFESFQHDSEHTGSVAHSENATTAKTHRFENVVTRKAVAVDRMNYSECQSMFNECAKLCEGDTDCWMTLRSALTEANNQLKRTRIHKDPKLRKNDGNNTSRMVSSNLECEQCPKRKRYKASYETQK